MFYFYDINQTALFSAVKSENIDLVKYLISLGKFDVNTEDRVFFYLFLYSF